MNIVLVIILIIIIVWIIIYLYPTSPREIYFPRQRATTACEFARMIGPTYATDTKNVNPMIDSTNNPVRGNQLIPKIYNKNETLWHSVDSKNEPVDIISQLRPIKGKVECKCACKYIEKY